MECLARFALWLQNGGAMSGRDTDARPMRCTAELTAGCLWGLSEPTSHLPARERQATKPWECGRELIHGSSLAQMGLYQNNLCETEQNTGWVDFVLCLGNVIEERRLIIHSKAMSVFFFYLVWSQGLQEGVCSSTAGNYCLMVWLEDNLQNLNWIELDNNTNMATLTQHRIESTLNRLKLIKRHCYLL